jgi:hypothetical protein
MTNYWGLVIRTNMYAGNFERQLCAHCTGTIGDCGVGKNYVNAENENLFDFEYEDEADIILNIPDDDDGCARPCSMWALEGETYTSVIIYFENKPSHKAIDIIKARSQTFLDAVKEKEPYLSKQMADGFKILGFKLVKSVTTEEEIDIPI